jgi:AhpD family alkylhydroperoxidase
MNTEITSMQARLDFYKAAPEGMRALVALETTLGKLGLETGLLDLVKLRASQINGCAYCVDLHCVEAKKRGETDRRLHAAAVWRDTPFFTPRERAALEWTEALTLVSQTHAPDEAFTTLGTEFGPAEMVNLSLAIGAINTWNRLSIGFRLSPAA